MKEYLILFSAGKDRPGIVDDISTLLLGHGGNIEDSRMAVMGGYFSAMILLSCPSEQCAALESRLKDLERLGLDAWLYNAKAPAEPAGPAGLPLTVDVTAMDHPGIVKKVVRILRDHDVNIESLSTRVSKAPMSGAPLFNLSLKGIVPSDQSIATVKKELTELAAEINLDLNFS